MERMSMLRSLKTPYSKRQATETSELNYRRPGFLFESSIPKHWLAGSVFKTHLLNSFTLIFPEGEKYFIRSIRKYLKNMDDPELRHQVLTFLKQEGQHSVEHEKFLQNLRSQGYEIDGFLNFVEKLTRNYLEPLFSDKLNLATTAGFEHFTALLAELGLSTEFLAQAHPKMRDLFEWHAAEEIEHKAVAFDVLQKVDANYFLRIIGVIIALVMLSTLSTAATMMLVAQDKKTFSNEVWKDFWEISFVREKLLIEGSKIFAHYFDPSFHPTKDKNIGLAQRVFSRIGIYPLTVNA